MVARFECRVFENLSVFERMNAEIPIIAKTMS